MPVSYTFRFTSSATERQIREVYKLAGIYYFATDQHKTITVTNPAVAEKIKAIGCVHGPIINNIIY